MSVVMLMVTLFLAAQGHEDGEWASPPHLPSIYEDQSLSSILELSHKDIYILWTTNMSIDFSFHPLSPTNQSVINAVSPPPDTLDRSTVPNINVTDGGDDGMRFTYFVSIRHMLTELDCGHIIEIVSVFQLKKHSECTHIEHHTISNQTSLDFG